jgi:hypothetical protein
MICGRYSPSWILASLLQFLTHIESQYDTLDGGSARRKADTYTGQHKHRKNEDKPPYIEWDSNPRSQWFSGRRQFMTYTVRPLISLLLPLIVLISLINTIVITALRLYHYYRTDTNTATATTINTTTTTTTTSTTTCKNFKLPIIRQTTCMKSQSTIKIIYSNIPDTSYSKWETVVCPLPLAITSISTVSKLRQLWKVITHGLSLILLLK